MEKDKLPERVRLRNGVIVLFKKRYKKPHKLAGKINNNWHCIINVQRGSRRIISTQTADFEQATQFAQKKCDEFLGLLSIGVSIKADLFRDIAMRSIQLNKYKYERRNQIESWKIYKSQIEKYWIEVFGNKKIGTIKTADISKQIRYLFQIKSLSDTTIKHYLLGLRWVFKQALDENKIIAIPTFPKLREYSKPFKPRPSFTEDEWIRFNEVLKTFDQDLKGKISGGNHGEASGDLNHQMYYRRALRDYCQVISYSGLRTGEASLLKWKDWKIINKGTDDEYCLLKVRADEKKGMKTGEREVVGLKYVNTALIRRKNDTIYNKPDDYIFSHVKRHEGQPIMSFRKSFEQALKKAKIGFDKEGNRIKGYTPYMLRGTYATLRLTKGNVDIYELAQNLGNKVEITEKYYSKAKPKDFAKNLSKITED